MFCVILEETHRCNLASMQLHRHDFECCVNKWLHQCQKSCIDARLKRWKVEETNHLIHLWKSSNPRWDWQWFFLPIVFKSILLNTGDPNKINTYGFCLAHVSLSYGGIQLTELHMIQGCAKVGLWWNSQDILHSISFHGLLLPSSQQIFSQLLTALILSYSSKTVQVLYFFWNKNV